MSDDYSRFEPPTEESPEWQDADSPYEAEEAVENYEEDYYDSSDAFLTDDDDLYYDDGSKKSPIFGNRLVLVLAVVAVIVILLLVLRACGVFGASGSKDATPKVKPTVTLAGQATSASGDSLAPTPTPAPPTATPLPPTPIPAGIRPGVTVQVVNTGEDGMSFRTGPGTKYVRIEVLKDGAVLKVVGGPEKADGFTWWRLQAEGGTIGWGVEDFLEPTGG